MSIESFCFIYCMLLYYSCMPTCKPWEEIAWPSKTVTYDILNSGYFFYKSKKRDTAQFLYMFIAVFSWQLFPDPFCRTGKRRKQQPMRRRRFEFPMGTSGGSGRCIEEHYTLILIIYIFQPHLASHIYKYIIDNNLRKAIINVVVNVCAVCGWLRSKWMEEVVRIMALPGPAGVGGHGCARPGRLLLVVRWSVGWCVRLRKKCVSALPWPYGVVYLSSKEAILYVIKLKLS